MDEEDMADLSAQCAEARRRMRVKVLASGDAELKDLYYVAVTLSEHEAGRRAVNKVLTRCHLSNRAEA